MSSITKNMDKEGLWRSFFNRSNGAASPSPILEKLATNLGRELKLRLKQVNSSSDNLHTTAALHLAVDNLTNTKSAIEKTLRQADLLTEEVALVLFDEHIEQTTEILQTETISRSSEATGIGVRTLNLLFYAKQAVKQKFSVITPISLPETVGDTDKINDETNQKLLPCVIGSLTDIPRMTISSTILYQLHHSLFPAERMLVGAGRKNGNDIEIDGVFDVTGKATSGYVKADANRLARALIVMSETEKYFALWIHSHPGRGKGATHPSGTDTNQEAEWLKDYSPNLINAIVVEDGFVRFWGKAIEEKRVTLGITGTGIVKESENESVFRLEF